MSIREVKCDHAIEHPKLHPVMAYVNIGNLIIAMCGTCYNALKGQVLEVGLRDFFTEQHIEPSKIPVKVDPKLYSPAPGFRLSRKDRKAKRGAENE